MYNRIGPLEVKVALALDLLEQELDLSSLDLIEQEVLKTVRNEPNGLVSFAGVTNITTLCCAFLKRCPTDHSQLISKCIDWVIMRRIESNSTLNWENSYGKTAYVAMNLIALHKLNPLYYSFAVLCTQYFHEGIHRDGRDGGVPPDSIAAIKSKSQLYTTSLFIRLLGVLVMTSAPLQREAFALMLSQLLMRPRRTGRTFLFVASTCLLFSSSAAALHYIFGWAFWQNAAASAAVGGIPYVPKLVRFILGKILGDTNE
jgi:hypothetical protein